MAFYFVYYAISFIKNRFVAESLKSFILVLGIVFSCIDIFGSYYFHFPLSNELGNILFTTHYKKQSQSNLSRFFRIYSNKFDTSFPYL